MHGIRFTRNGQCVLVERNKYAPWGRGVKPATAPRRAPKVLRHGNGRLDAAPAG